MVSFRPSPGFRPSGFLLASFGPVEMCELSEVSELSPQDAMESLSVKGAMDWSGPLFEETQGLVRPSASGCSLFNHF